MLTLRASHRIHVVRSTGVASAQLPQVFAVLGSGALVQVWPLLQVVITKPCRQSADPARSALVAAVHVNVFVAF